MTSAVTIKIHEAPTQTPLELAQFEQMSHIPSQFDEGIRSDHLLIVAANRLESNC